MITGLELAGLVFLFAGYVCWSILYALSSEGHALAPLAMPGLLVFLVILVVYCLLAPSIDNDELFDKLKSSIELRFGHYW